MSRGIDREAGYNLVVLVIAVTILNIALAASLPLWSTAIRRDKEEELVFRGYQYAEAIRVFRNRYQRLPVRLEELVEVEPRCIRQLWKDPMTEDGKWALIHENVPQGALPPGAGGDEDGREGDEDGDDGIRVPAPGDEVSVGPITGVKSRSSQSSILVFNGQERYDQWLFTVDVFSGQNFNRGGVGVPGAGPTGQGLVLSTRWLGRPMRGGLMIQGNVPNPEPQGPGGGRRRRGDERRPGGQAREPN